MNQQRKAFTLVELSIVLVILGLLVGGVLTGQSLIHAAELRSVTTQYEGFITAEQTFRDKYFALPGDMNNATQFWGRLNSNGDCVTSSSAAVGSPGACDGNGSGFIDFQNSAGAGVANKMHQFWRHLANAGLVEGNFTGLSGPAGVGDVVPGTNSPKSKLSNAGWGVAANNPGDGGAYNLPGGYGNYMTIGGHIANDVPLGLVFKPEDAWNIDSKVDDGKPATGKVIADYNGGGNTCTTSANSSDLTGIYALSNATIQCALYFVNAF